MKILKLTMLFVCRSVFFFFFFQMVKVNSSRVYMQLSTVAEENAVMLKTAFVNLVELLRQHRVVGELLKEARVMRASAPEAANLSSVTTVHKVILNLQQKFENAHITTDTRVCVTSQSSSVSGGSGNTSTATPISSLQDPKKETLVDLHTVRTTTEDVSKPRHPDVEVTSAHEPSFVSEHLDSSDTKTKPKAAAAATTTAKQNQTASPGQPILISLFCVHINSVPGCGRN